MLTAAANSPNAVMLSIAEVAERDGVSKPTVSVRVKRFIERHNLAHERDGQGRVARVNVAQYDLLRGRLDDPSKAQQPNRLPTSPATDGDSYDEALRRKTAYDAELKRLAVAEATRRLVDVEIMAQAQDRTAQIMIDALNRLEEASDDIAAAVGRDGARGAHSALRRIKAEILADISDAMAAEARAARAMVDESGAQRLQ